MGQFASSFIKRPIKNYNVHIRAEKILNQTKPTIAPRHPSTIDKIDSFLKVNPNIAEVLKNKNESLDKMLKGMVVKTAKFGEIKTKAKIERRLPEDRKKFDDPEFGYLEPINVQEGKITIKQAMNFLSQHFENPKLYTEKNISNEYKLPLSDVKKILNHFKIFYVQLPKNKEQPKTGIESFTHFLSSKTIKKQIAIKNLNNPSLISKDSDDKSKT